MCSVTFDHVEPSRKPRGFFRPNGRRVRQQLDDFETFVVGARSEEGGGKADFSAVEGGWVGSKVVALGVGTWIFGLAFCLLALVITF